MRVFEYIIITNTRHDYRAEGTSHADAMRNFIDAPHITYGFHGGDYRTEDGETFIVIGPTQEQPESNTIMRLVAKEQITYVFRTPEQITAENDIRAEARRFLPAAKPDALITVDAEDHSSPPHNKTAPAGEIGAADQRGLWINNKRIPWSAIRGIDHADAQVPV